MTDQQIKNKANQLKEEEIREAKRANRARESIEGGKLEESRWDRASRERVAKSAQRAGILSTVISTAGNVAKSAFGKAASGNHPKWYNSDKAAVDAAANISFDTPIGYPIPKSTQQTGWASGAGQYDSIPVIQTLSWMPSVGGAGENVSYSGYSTINRMATLVYDYLRNHNSGASNYDIPDIVILLVALLEPRVFHAEMRRLVAVLNGPVTENATTPRHLITALGYDYDDLVAHKEDLRGFVDQFGIQLKAIPFPKVFMVAERQLWMQSCIFKDSNVARAQLIAFKREHYFEYDWANGSLVPKDTYVDPDTNQQVGLTGRTWAASMNKTFKIIKAYGEELLAHIVRNPAIGNIVGDMIKAFTKEGMWYEEPGINDERIEYIYDENVLDQIDNATLVGCISGLYFAISQDSNGNVRQGYIDSTNDRYIPVVRDGNVIAPDASAQPLLDTVGNLNLILNSHNDNPSNDDVMVKSRLMTQYGVQTITTVGGTTGKMLYVKSSGTEVLTYASFWFMDTATNLIYDVTTAGLPILFSSGDTDANNMRQLVNFMKTQQFEHRPVIIPLAVDAAGAVSIIDECRDYSNYAVVPAHVVSNLHRVALLSEWGIPEIITK